MTKEKHLSEQWKEGWDLGYEKAKEDVAEHVKKLKEVLKGWSIFGEDNSYVEEPLIKFNEEIDKIFGTFDNHPACKGEK